MNDKRFFITSVRYKSCAESVFVDSYLSFSLRGWPCSYCGAVNDMNCIGSKTRHLFKPYYELERNNLLSPYPPTLEIWVHPKREQLLLEAIDDLSKLDRLNKV